MVPGGTAIKRVLTVDETDKDVMEMSSRGSDYAGEGVFRGLRCLEDAFAVYSN